MNNKNSEQPIVYVRDLGLVNYADALTVQEEYFNFNTNIKLQNKTSKSLSSTKNTLLICQHPHVYTLGKSGSKDHLLLSKEELFNKSISFYNNNRGGDITYHGPGQIVGYPILDLEQFNPDIKQYMYNLEEVMIKTIAEYGLKGDRIKGAVGVWLDAENKHARKICAFGVKTSRWITMHGWALNVNTNLEYFNYIVPCGIADKGVTSISKELGEVVSEKEVSDKIIANFRTVFNVDLKYV